MYLFRPRASRRVAPVQNEPAQAHHEDESATAGAEQPTGKKSFWRASLDACHGRWMSPRISTGASASSSRGSGSASPAGDRPSSFGSTAATHLATPGCPVVPAPLVTAKPSALYNKYAEELADALLLQEDLMRRCSETAKEVGLSTGATSSRAASSASGLQAGTCTDEVQLPGCLGEAQAIHGQSTCAMESHASALTDTFSQGLCASWRNSDLGRGESAGRPSLNPAEEGNAEQPEALPRRSGAEQGCRGQPDSSSAAPVACLDLAEEEQPQRPLGSSAQALCNIPVGILGDSARRLRATSWSPDPGTPVANAIFGQGAGAALLFHLPRADLFQELEKVSELGHGGFGNVFLVRDAANVSQFALKVIPKERVGSKAREENLAREITLTQRLGHPNVMRLHQIVQTEDSFQLLLDFAGIQNLFHFQQAQEHKVFAPNRASQIFRQIAEAVAHCHARGVVHRDLKHENVVVREPFVATLVDFGTANLTTAPCERVGTAAFMAPEVLEVQRNGFDAGRADVWSLGVLLLEALRGLDFLLRQLKWKGKLKANDPVFPRKLRRYLSKGGTLMQAVRRKLEVGPALEALVQGMLSLDVQSRWDAAQVVSSEWLQEMP